jgi:hypothetical protein
MEGRRLARSELIGQAVKRPPIRMRDRPGSGPQLGKPPNRGACPSRSVLVHGRASRSIIPPRHGDVEDQVMRPESPNGSFPVAISEDQHAKR